MMDIKKVLPLWFINKVTQNQQLAEELHNPIIRKFKKEEFIHHLKTIFGVLI